MNLNLIITFLKKHPSWIVFGLSFSIIFGPAFTLLNEYSYDLAANPDIDTYLNLAEFNFDQSPIRRYRVIIPFLAAIVNFILEPIFQIIKPYNFPGTDFSLSMSFFIVNSLLMSFFGVIVFKLCTIYKSSTFSSVLALLSVLTCRWTAYYAGLPIVDSLYLVVIALMLLGIAKRSSAIIIFVIFIGPWAKESFIFFIPLLLLYAPLSRIKQLGLILLSGIVVFSFRYAFDIFNEFNVVESLTKDTAHLSYILPSLKRLFSFHGIYELISIVGVWGIILLFLLSKSIRDFVKKNTPSYSLLYILIVFIHVVLSTDLARMFYLITPLFAVWFAIIFDKVLLKFQDKVATI